MKRALCVVWVLCVVFILLPAAALAADPHEHPVCGATCTHLTGGVADHEAITFTPIESGSAMPTAAGSYYLTQDVTLDATWAVPTGTTNLCLNGYTIKYTSSDTSASVIQLGGANLNICDCQSTGKVDGENHIGITNNGTGTLTLYGGTVTSTGYRGVHNNSTGSVVVDGGTVISNHTTAVALSNQTRGSITVKSGSVEGNNVGIGISGSGGVLSISGGTVYGRSFGVSIYYGTLDISGGRVSSTGYGLYQGGGTVNFTGGTIESIGSGTALYFYDQGLAGGGTSSYPGVLNIGSGSVIIGSTGSPYDIHLRDNRVITVAGALTNTAPYRVSKVGGTIGTVIAQGSGSHTITAADAGKFTAGAYTVVLDSAGNTLKLAAHSHPVCGSVCSHTPAHAAIIYDKTITATGSITESGNYVLTGDVTRTSGLGISGTGTVVNLCLNGHKLSRAGGRVIEVGSGATLNICDCNGSSGSHEILNPATVDVTSDTVMITGGVITGGTNGGVVLFGTLNLYGGTIAGNTNTSNYGGGVNMSTGVFNMYGGSITANRTAYGGGGVGIYGEFAMYGGTIAGNSAAGNGGGVHANRDDQTYYLYGGTISADGAAHAVYSQNGKFALSGAPVIRGGNTVGADIYLNSFNTSSIIIAGALTNTAPYRVFKEDATEGTVIATATTAAHADASKFASANTGYALAANNTATGERPGSVYLVAPAISFTTQPQNKTVTAGSITASDALMAAASVTPSGTPALNWYECDAQGTIIDTILETGGTFHIPADLAAGTYHYLCEAIFTNALMAKSNVATVTVNDAPPPDPPGPGPSPAPGPAVYGGTGGSTYTGNEYPGSFAGGVLTVQGPCDHLTSVMVDHVILIRERDYTLKCGSTVVTFTPAFLATLRDGEHTLRVQFTDGRYWGTFTTPLASGAAAASIPDVPATGRPARAGPERAAMFVCFLGGVCCLVARIIVIRRRKDSSLRPFGGRRLRATLRGWLRMT